MDSATMQPRMKNPAMILTGTGQAIQALSKAAHSAGVSPQTMGLVHLRVSQINGCSACVDAGSKRAAKSGESPERLATVAAWRDAPYFSDEERAALALAEAATRLADHPNAVDDAVWAVATSHFDEEQMAGILLWIAVSNLFNRLNGPTRQIPGSWD